MFSDTTSEKFFESKYLGSQDPWNFAASTYELERYSAIVDSLGSRKFHRAFEPGCSVGVLTEQLAGFCDSLYASDISRTAVAKATARCQHLANVDITHGSIEDALPAGEFDLIVLSEIGYYFQFSELARIGQILVSRLEPAGVLLGAHWLGHSPDHVLSGDQVHASVGELTGIKESLSERHNGFRLNQWTKQ